MNEFGVDAVSNMRFAAFISLYCPARRQNRVADPRPSGDVLESDVRSSLCRLAARFVRKACIIITSGAQLIPMIDAAATSDPYHK